MMQDVIRVASVGSGIGCSDFGLKCMSRRFISIPIAIEKEEAERNTYRANHRVEKFHRKMEDYFPTKKDNDLITCVIGTPPCQDITHMNVKRDTTSDRAYLIYEVLRIIEECNPDHFLIENVRAINGAYDRNDKLFVNVLEKTLKNLGYKLMQDPRDRKHRYIFNCADYGVPQNRERYILVGSKKKTPKIPEPLPRVDFGFVLNKINSKGDTKHSSKTVERYKKLEVGKWTKPPNMNTYSKFFVLPPNGKGQCPTILNQDKTDIIWKNRKISVEEICALQSLPKTYVLRGTKKEKHRGLGNVLPARVSYEFLKQFVENPDKFPVDIDYPRLILEPHSKIHASQNTLDRLL